MKNLKNDISKLFHQETKVKKIVLIYENSELEYTFPKPVLVGSLIRILRQLGEKQDYGKIKI